MIRRHPFQTLGDHSPLFQSYSGNPFLHDRQVSSLLPGYRQRWRSWVILLSSVLFSSNFPSVSLFTFSIPLSISSLSSHSSRVQFPSTAVAMWLCDSLTLLILLWLAINDDGLDLIITLLWITPPAAKVWHHPDSTRASKAVFVSREHF